MLMSVGDLIEDVQREDPGVTASVFSKGGMQQQLVHTHTYMHTLRVRQTDTLGTYVCMSDLAIHSAG